MVDETKSNDRPLVSGDEQSAPLEHPTLAAAIERFTGQFGTVDETTTVVLKGHLLIEEALDGIISGFLFHPEHISDTRLSFAQKLSLARSMSDRENENSMWRIGTALNSLRNELSHNLESPKRAAKVKAVLDAFRTETVDDAEAQKHAERAEPEAIMMACALFVGFLASFKAEVDQFKQVVTGLRAVRNIEVPKRPAH